MSGRGVKSKAECLSDCIDNEKKKDWRKKNFGAGSERNEEECNESATL